LLFNAYLEYDIRKIKEDKVGLKLMGNIKTDANNEVGLEVMEKTKYTMMSLECSTKS
jgi:hypothetical protein